MLRRCLLPLLACFSLVTPRLPAGSDTSLRLPLKSARERSVQVIVFDAPGATQTYPSAINNNGTVTGFYVDANGDHGFLRDMNGQFVTFGAPGSQGIYPSSINSTGAVAGSFTDTSQHGFVRTANGTWIAFDVPGKFPSSSQNPICINDSGIITGPYINGTSFYGFLRSVGGSLTTISYPESTYTYATGINGAGTVTGIYNDASFNSHGFLRGVDGTWVNFDVPGGYFGFFPPTLSINAGGTVVGSFLQGSTQGFLRNLSGPLVTFEVDGAAGTQPGGINAGGTVVGSYQDSSFTYHGFLRTPSAVVYTFSIPDATGTFAFGINDSGVVVGSYQDASQASHGFLLIL
jgi:uncharacterized membrane protein